MDSPIAETANYQLLYYFSESASGPSAATSQVTLIPGSEWVPTGTTITISIVGPPTYCEGVAFASCSFVGWSCSGVGCYSGSTRTVPITIVGPTGENANLVVYAN